jgi:catalase
MLQGRLFSYPDTHRYRLGKNYEQIPINCPYRARVAHYSRDGAATVNGNFGGAPNYEPNTQDGPVQDAKYAWHQAPISGTTGRFAYPHPNTCYEQPRTLWNKVFSET